VFFRPEDENIEEYYLVDENWDMHIWEVLRGKGDPERGQITSLRL